MMRARQCAVRALSPEKTRKSCPHLPGTPNSEELEDFCGVEGLTVGVENTVVGRFLVNTHKPGTAPYFGQVVTIDAVYTNDGDVVTERVLIAEKDQKITVNDDGTLTILVLATGNSTVYGPDGKAIARNPGQVRYEVLVDYNGTVADPSDDVFLEFLGQVKGSTGRNDDFCEAVLTILG
jgi:hypothetical protein